MAFEQVEHLVTAGDDGSRLDRFVRRLHPEVNQGHLEKLLRGGDIRLNGAKAKSSTRLQEGGVITMPKMIAQTRESKPAKTAESWVIEAIRNAVISIEDGFIVLNKPSGLATQGGSGIRHHVDGALPQAFPQYEKCRLVHRLDRETSGVLVIATDLAKSQALTKGFAKHDHDKTYLALVAGVPKISAGRITAPMMKSGGRGGFERMAVDDGGQSALTLYRVLENMGKSVALVALRPKTGRTHQLRVHMAELGCPILGDSKYGGKPANPHPVVKRLCLHACGLTIIGHEPITAPIPDDLEKVFSFFGLDSTAALRKATDPACFETL